MASDANTYPSCTIGSFEHNSSTLNRLFALLLVKYNENFVILTNVFQHLQANSSRMCASPEGPPSGPDLR
jgi:hypothetical protein